ncbi:protein-disulfide reductase DsbD domain-containing protein [Chitinophagaceae bacterium LWZ2-11]
MKKFLLVSLLSVVGFAVQAQIKDPVIWKYEAKKKAAGVYELTITATVESPWHIYSQNTGKGGPVATAFTYKANPLVTLDGKTKENGKLEKVFDKSFNTNVLYYSNTVTFVQTVKVKGGVKTNVSGVVEYMVCDDEQCLPPTKKPFDIKLQ